MAASLNKAFIMGNLTRDPELRYVPSGSAVTNFTVAVNRVYKDKTGEKKEDTSFIRVVVWGKTAENCGEYLSKGSPVLVEGRLQSRSWETQDGQKRSTMEVIADSVKFLSRAPRRDNDFQNYKASSSVESVNLDAETNASTPAPASDTTEEIPF